MHKIKVKLGRRAYEILIGRGILDTLGSRLLRLKLGTDAYVITNSWIKRKYGVVLARVLRKSGFNVYFKVVADSEKSKSLETASIVIKDLARFDKKRKVFIIAFGGGVVGDLAGFVASVYKRGINYVQVPTTLLAQVDSSIGGKTAVDLTQGKNLVGAFYQPRVVLSEINFLKSLEKKQLAGGLAEVIKYAIIKDRKLFDFLENNNKVILRKDPAALERIVRACSRIKADIVSRDERETVGLRTILNFGHTIGHAIEAGSGYRGYGHGQAIALGMLCAADISCALKMIDAGLTQRIKRLIRIYGLPVQLKGVSLDKIVQAQYRDKKFTGKENKFVLIRGIASSQILRNIQPRLIRQALEKIA